jgi:hypothetical protein
MNVIPVVPRTRPLKNEIPPVVQPEKIITDEFVIRIPNNVLRSQIYYEIEILPSSYLDGTDKFVVPVNSPVLLGFLTSSLFAVWVKGISQKDKITIDDKKMYNNFPFPDVSNKQSYEIEKAVNYVFEARAETKFSKLIDIYTPDSMPDFLLKAHENLDRVLFEVLGLPTNSSNEEILEFLFQKYVELLNAN